MTESSPQTTRDRQGLLQRLFERLPKWSGESIESIAIALLVAAGLFFRMRGVLVGPTIEMWIDEASWAMKIYERPLAEHLIRPPLYVLLTRLITTLIGYSEFGFRFLPWAAGMASPFLAVLLARRFLNSAAARIFYVAVICLSMNAIDFSKEFKPYAIGLMLQLLLPILVARWLESRSLRDLLLVCVLSPLGVMFCQDVIFLYPAIFLVLAIETYRSRNLKQLAISVGSGAATAALLLAMYLLIWNRLPKDDTEAHWGNRYDVFHLEKSEESYVGWVSAKYTGLATMPGVRRISWSEERVSPRALLELQDLDRTIWLLLHITGLFVVVRYRRWREGLLFWSPFLVSGVFNALGFWPYGPFRVNLFATAPATALVALAFDRGERTSAKPISLVPAIVLVLLPMLVFEQKWHASKQKVYDAGVFWILRSVAKQHPDTPAKKEPLFLDTHSCQPLRYYTQYHPRGIKMWEQLGKRLEPSCVRNFGRAFKTIRRLPKGQRVWLMAAMGRDTPKGWPKDVPILSRTRRAHHIMIEAQAP